MKKLTKALKEVLKKLEVKSLDQIKEMSTADLNKHMTALNKCYDYDMTDDENETVETLINDIKGVLENRLADNVLQVADKKTAPKKDKKTADKTAKKTAPKKDTPADTKPADKTTAPAKQDKPKQDKKKAPTAPADKKKKDTPAPKKKTLKDVLKWKSLIKMTLEDNVHYCYVVDIEADFKDVLCRSTDITSLVFQFDTKALESATYTDPNNDTWILEYTGKELK